MHSYLFHARARVHVVQECVYTYICVRESEGIECVCLWTHMLVARVCSVKAGEVCLCQKK